MRMSAGSGQLVESTAAIRTSVESGPIQHSQTVPRWVERNIDDSYSHGSLAPMPYSCQYFAIPRTSEIERRTRRARFSRLERAVDAKSRCRFSRETRCSESQANNVRTTPISV